MHDKMEERVEGGRITYDTQNFCPEMEAFPSFSYRCLKERFYPIEGKHFLCFNT